MVRCVALHPADVPNGPQPGALECPPLAAPGRSSAVTMAASDFRSVYEAHADFVFRVVRGMGVHASLVADAVQDIFVVVHRRLPEFDGRHSLKSWLFAIAYRVARDYRRKQARHEMHEALDDNDQLRAPGPSPSEWTEQRDAVRELEAMLDRLDDDQRVVLVLSDIEELTAPEITELTGTPLSTVYTRLRRARIALSNALALRKRRSR